VIARLQRATPYAAIPADNPLFTYEARRIRWGQSAWQLVSYSLAVWSLIPFLMTTLWGLLLADYPNLRVNLISLLAAVVRGRGKFHPGYGQHHNRIK
jgi:hypothetical protein